MDIFVSSSDFGWSLKPDDIIELGPYGKSTGRADIVRDIYNTWLGEDGNIDCLYLVAHGNSGVIWLGKEGIGKVGAALFAKLKGTFDAGCTGIEIHGCAIASSTDISRWAGTGTPATEGPGFDFMLALAKNSGVKVTAPIDSVWGPRAAYSYDGVRTMTVYPSGSAYYENMS